MNCFHCLLFAFHFIMLLYNVTIKIDWSIHDEWLAWMQDIHIPEVLGTGCFSSHKLLRLLQVDEEDGPTYAVQYFAESKAFYNRYATQYAATHNLEATGKWGDKFISFNTLMQVVN